jgi:hypothetical protein
VKGDGKVNGGDLADEFDRKITRLGGAEKVNLERWTVVYVFIIDKHLCIPVADIFAEGRLDQLFDYLRACRPADLDEEATAIAYGPFERLSEGGMRYTDPLHKHHTFLLVPQFQILEAFLLGVDDEDGLVGLFDDLQVVQDVLVVVNSHFLQHDLLILLHQPVDPIPVVGYSSPVKDCSDLFDNDFSDLDEEGRGVEDHDCAEDAVAHVEGHLHLDGLPVVLPLLLLARYLPHYLVAPADHFLEQLDLVTVFVQFLCLLFQLLRQLSDFAVVER